MRILIAGCGYVGSALALQLHAQGHVVFGLRRNPTRLPEGITPVVADLLDPASLRALPENLDYIFYTASANGHSEAAYRAAYVTGLQNLLQALHGQTPRHLFYTSSTGVYDQNNGEWIDESSPATADRPTARALRDGEALVASASFPGTVLRFSGIYGPGRTRLIDSVADGTARLDHQDTRVLNHIHRDDCAGALAHLMALPDPAPLYLGTDNEPRSRNALLTWIAAAIPCPTPPLAEDTPETSAPAERGGNRRYRNDLLRESGYTFIYPSFREGYGTLILARNE